MKNFKLGVDRSEFPIWLGFAFDDIPLGFRVDSRWLGFAVNKVRGRVRVNHRG